MNKFLALTTVSPSPHESDRFVGLLKDAGLAGVDLPGDAPDYPITESSEHFAFWSFDDKAIGVLAISGTLKEIKCLWRKGRAALEANRLNHDWPLAKSSHCALT